MSEHIEPGTKLPWHLWKKSKLHIASRKDETTSTVIGSVDAYHWYTEEEHKRAVQDAAYIVHACNSYPQLESKLAELEKPCVWTYDDVHEKWDGACGIGWYFFESDETPTGHGMNYCPRCQHPITEESNESAT